MKKTNSIPAPKTKPETIGLVKDIVDLIRRQEQLQSALCAELDALRADYETEIAPLRAAIAAKTAAVETWAKANPQEFPKRKSLDFLFATVGWQTGQPQLKLKPKQTWDTVLATLKSAAPYHDFVRTKEEVNRQLILDRRDSLLPGDLAAMGLRIFQKEYFYVRPKTEPAAKPAPAKIAA